MLVGMDEKKRISHNLTGMSKIAVMAVIAVLCCPLVTKASSISGIQNNINNYQQQLDKINSQIAELENEQDLIQEELDDFNAELVNTMTSINLLEDQIAQKQAQIEDKQKQVEETQKEYDAAVQKEEDQKKSMAAQVRLIYENGDDSYLNVLLKGGGIGDVLNNMDYIEKVYEYNKKMLNDYIETKEMVLALWNQLRRKKPNWNRICSSLHRISRNWTSRRTI